MPAIPWEELALTMGKAKASTLISLNAHCVKGHMLGAVEGDKLILLGLRSCLGDQARISPHTHTHNNYKGKV